MINVLEFNQFNELNEKSNTPIDNSEYWTLITIMACENYSDQKQGMADKYDVLVAAPTPGELMQRGFLC
jgi:hypothetical protein